MAAPAIVIQNNNHYHSISFDYAAKAGYMTNSTDVKIAGDLTIKGSNSFSITGCGVKFDITKIAIQMEADFGESFKFLNGANLRTSTADGKAYLAEADALLAEAEKIVAASETIATKMKTGVSSIENGGATVVAKGANIKM